MSENHTPGPWDAQGFIVFAEDKLIAKVFPHEEGRANARVLAASTELLESLKWCVGEIEGDPRYQHEYMYPQELRAARAAIAKATGKEG